MEYPNGIPGFPKGVPGYLARKLVHLSENRVLNEFSDFGLEFKNMASLSISPSFYIFLFNSGMYRTRNVTHKDIH